MGRSLAVAVLTLCLFAARARAQDGYHRVDDREARLAAVFHAQHDRAQTQRVLGGIGLLGVPLSLGGFSVGLLLSSDPVFQAAGIAALGVGGVYLALGLSTLASRSRAEIRWDEWRDRRARGPFTALELARYEGELRQQARDDTQAAVRAAVFDLVLGAVALGAGIGLGLAARENGWLLMLEGAAACLMSTLFGVINLVIAIIGGASEQDLRSYVRGNAPTSALTLQVTPTGLAGTF